MFTEPPVESRRGIDIAQTLAADAVLDPDITPNGVPSTGRPENHALTAVLLTGATGFVGAFLLHELLRRTPAEVYCLVRARDENEAAQRIRWTMVKYRMWREDLADRIIAVTGDLERPRIGIDAALFRSLANRVQAVYHNGARVNHAEPYERLKSANVDGTADVLRFVCTGEPKPIHFVSSGSVVERNGPNPAVVCEDARVPPELVLPRGYIRSKWVAEELMRAAAERGIPTTTYRLNRVSGHSATGVCGTADSFWNFIRAMIVLGAAPVLEVDKINLVPVDHVAGAIVRLAGLPDTGGNAYHLMADEPIAVETILDQLRSLGYRLDTLSFDAWANLLEETAGRMATSGDSSLVPAALLTASYRGRNTPFRWGQTNAKAGLAGSDVPPATIDADVIARYIDYFVSARFFPSPRRQRHLH
jgi:thioester reductase-like protein